VSLAAALLLAQRGERPPVDLQGAADDILVARVLLSHEADPGEGCLPLFVEEYAASQITEIDALQARWRRNLMFCLPEIPERILFNILLASREAVLNGLQHGCAGDRSHTTRFGITYAARERVVRVFVEDPGRGHQFDPAVHARSAANDPLPGHRGLMLIHHLATRLATERNGASLVLDFSLENSAAIHPPAITLPA
jgi:anti-sigma regulatory factor (Ser/Thr protein kinase)